MTLATALQIAAAIHKSFSTDAGAAEYLLSDTAEHQVEARPACPPRTGPPDGASAVGGPGITSGIPREYFRTETGQ